MGQPGEPLRFDRDDFRRYRRKVKQCLDVFARMLEGRRFAEERLMTGMEVELYLVDAAGDPTPRNAEFLRVLADPMFQSELARFTIEANALPAPISGAGFDEHERRLRAALNAAEAKANRAGIGLVIIGILPTVGPEHAVLENISSNPRYRALNDQILAARVEPVSIDIAGPERLQVRAESIMPEAATTSLQFHLQVTPGRFASYWNASQAIAGVQVAVGANSPFLFGKRLWQETRVPLFEQATDTRLDEHRNQGVRPRVWFGERWVTSIFDLFAENVRYFPTLLPLCTAEDPEAVFETGAAPRLEELRVHNGTVWRWNRPIYDPGTGDGPPHLRVENRVLSAGPTVVDMMANAAFYYGLVRALAGSDRPVWSELTFAEAEHNFTEAARFGLQANLAWPGGAQVRADHLILERLLPQCAEGLDEFGVDPATRDHLLGIIEQRCISRRNGAVWQVETVAALEAAGRDRPAALREMLVRYREHMHSNEPVHTWPIG